MTTIYIHLFGYVCLKTGTGGRDSRDPTVQSPRISHSVFWKAFEYEAWLKLIYFCMGFVLDKESTCLKSSYNLVLPRLDSTRLHSTRDDSVQ